MFEVATDLAAEVLAFSFAAAVAAVAAFAIAVHVVAKLQDETVAVVGQEQAAV